MEELHKRKIELGQARAKARKLGLTVGDEKPETLEQALEMIAAVNALIPQERTDEQAAKKAEKNASAEVQELTERLARLEALLTKQQVQPASVGGLNEEQFTRLLAKVNEGKTNSEGLVREDWIDPDDRLEKPVTFFTPFERDFLTFVPNGGVNEAPPNNKKFLRFKNAFRWVQQTVNGAKIRTVATLTVGSKKEMEWVMRHPKYGRTVFLDSESAVKFTEMSDYARIYRKHLGVLASVGDGKLAPMAHELGIPVSARTTPDQYREAIAEKRAQAEQAQTAQAQTAWAQQRAADKMLLQGLGVTTPSHSAV